MKLYEFKTYGIETEQSYFVLADSKTNALKKINKKVKLNFSKKDITHIYKKEKYIGEFKKIL